MNGDDGMEALMKDIAYAIRSLLRRPAFSALAIITLALGIGANAAIFSVLYAVLLRPLPYPQAERIVRIDETEGRGGMGVSPPNFRDFQQLNRSFENIAAYATGSFILSGGTEPLRVVSAEVSHELFPILRVNPLIGRSFSEDEEKEGQTRVALIGYGLWQRRFGGDRTLIGKDIILDGKSYSVIGVMPPDFEFPIQAERIELWVPLSLPDDLSQLRGAHYLDVVGRLKSDVRLSQAHSDLEAIAARVAQQYPKLVSGKTKVVPLKTDLVADVQPYLIMLAGAVTLVLLIATANVASLMLARAAERQKEITLRLALGATKIRILRQLLAESLTLSLIGGLGGVILATWGTELLIGIAPGDVPRLQSADFNIWVLAFALLMSVITGILFGIAPTLRVSAPDLHSTLKEGEGRTAIAPRQSFRKVLVISEIAIALVLLCGAGLLIRTLWRLNSVSPGFDPEVVAAEILLPNTKYPDDARRITFFNEVLDRLKSRPDVASVGATSNLPMSGTNMVFLAAVEGSGIAPFPAGFRSVSPDYFRTMSIPLLKGRAISDRDTASTPSVVVVNETMAHQISSDGNAIGKRIKHGFKETIAEVVGVVGDVKYAGLDQESKPEMYAPFAQRPWPFLRIVAKANSQGAALSNIPGTIRSIVREIDQNQPVDKIMSMGSLLSASTAPRRFYMQLLGSFATLAFVLASIGIYGVVSYSVSQRTREIGIRMALGAKASDVLRLVLVEGVKLIVPGVAFGLLGAFVATRVLRGLLFQVKPTDPATFLVFSVLLAAVAVLACYVPARRATKVDPLVALRYE